MENFRDLTKPKGLWGKLREERNKAQQYLNIAGVIIVAINEKGVVSLINKKGCDVLGYREDEIIGKNWFDHFIPKRLKKKIIPVSKSILAGDMEQAEYFENPILTKSGEERLIAWHNTMLKNEHGEIYGHLSSGEDVTDRRIAEESLP